MTKSRRTRRRRAASSRGPLALIGVFALLVAINVYVFLIRPGNVKDLRAAVEAGRVPGTGVEGAPSSKEPTPAAPAPGVAVGRNVDGQVQKSDTLGKLLEREGLTRSEASEVTSALDGVWDPRGLREGQKYTLGLDDDGNVKSFTLKVNAALVVIVERQGGKLVARKSEAKTEIRVERVHGVIASSLYDAVKTAGESTELVADMAELFAGEMNFYVDTHEGDAFALVVEKKYLDGVFWRYGKILAAEYVGKEGTHRAFFYDGPGAIAGGGYFDEDGESCTRSFLKTPLKFARLSSGFNPRRMHPVLHRVKGHFGTDFAAPTGTPVWAAGDARVVSAAPAGGAGNMIVLDHGDGLVTFYMHLSRFAKGLRPGQRVAQKQVIGYVGTTGLSTGPHLHLGVKQNGKWIDFAALKPRRAAGIPKAHRAAFRAAMAPRIAELGGQAPAATPATPVTTVATNR